MADAPESVFPDMADISGRPVELTDHQRYILKTVGPTWQWSAAAFVAAVAFAALGWLAAESGRDRLADRADKLEARLNEAERQLAALPPFPPCQVWVRSTDEMPMASRRCEEFRSAGIQGAKIEILNERASYITDEWGRAPIWRRNAFVRVSAPGFLPIETPIQNCGDDTTVQLTPRLPLWPDSVVEVPLVWTRQEPVKGVWP